MTLNHIKNKENLFDPSLKSGLYLITCIPLEKHYVGESEYVTRRLNAHKLALNRGIHENNEMQKDFDEYGLDQFLFQKFRFGKSLSKEECQKFETLILSTLPEQNCYNFFSDLHQRDSETNSFYTKHHRPETRAALSVAKQGVSSTFATQTDNVKQQVSETICGQKNPRKSVSINSVYYESIAKASKELGISRRLIRERCHSAEKKFENYKWVHKTDITDYKNVLEY
jgi:group I intron endonuclease